MPGGKTRAQWQQQADEIERLTDALTAKDDAELDAYAAGKKDAEARLQARFEALDKVRVAVLKHRDNKNFLNMDTWNACVYAAEAATELGERQ